MNFPRAIAALGLTGWLLLASASAYAQAEPEDLVKLRAAFESKARMASSLWNDYYNRALAPIETELAAAGDYEQARAIKSRRDELAALSAAAPAAPGAVSVTPGVLLPAAQARFSGVVSERSGSLVGWRTSSCAAEWMLPRLTPGAYHVQVTYTMVDRVPEPGTSALATRTVVEPATTAIFSFREVSLLASASKNLRALTLEKTPASGEVKTLTTTVPIELTKPPFTLRLATTASYPSNVIVVQSVRLVPATGAAPAGAGATTATESGAAVSLAAELEQWRKTSAQQLAAVRKPIVDAYVASLSALQVPAADADDLASIVESEGRRARKLIEGLPSKGSGGMGLDNFEEVSGAKFVPDPGNSGDRFKVEHDGKQFFVRLAWVVCPPADPNDSRALKHVMAKFGCDASDVTSLALAAKEFTALYLEGHPLQLLLRQSKKHEDTISALVFLEDIGLFQGVLIDHGLAVVDAPAGGTRGALETGFLGSLQDRETTARAQKPAPGGWALKTAP
jgi:hypothetical protein